MAQSAIVQWVGLEPRQTSHRRIITIKITTLLQGQDFHYGTQFTVLNSTVKQIFYAVKHQCLRPYVEHNLRAKALCMIGQAI